MWYPPRKRTIELDSQLRDLAEHLSLPGFEIDDTLSRVSVIIRHLAQISLVSPSQLREWIWVASRMRISVQTDTAGLKTAGSALLWLERHNQSAQITSADINWVLAKTINELRAQLGPRDSWSFLTPDEISRVEKFLEEISARDSGQIENLDERLRDYLVRFADVQSETYLPGIEGIVNQLTLWSRGDDATAVDARAALIYLLEEADVVPDKLGYIGLVDDIHVIEQTFRKVAERSTWDKLLPRFYERWPFLSDVGFGVNGTSVHLSPFMQVSSGVALSSMEPVGSRVCVILPEVGPMGLVVSFLAAVALLRGEGTANRLRFPDPGDHLFLGYADEPLRVRYDGVSEYDGNQVHFITHRTGRASIPKSYLAVARIAKEPHKKLSSNEDLNAWKKGFGHSPIHFLLGFDPAGAEPASRVLLLTRRRRLESYIETVRPMGENAGVIIPH